MAEEGAVEAQDALPEASAQLKVADSSFAVTKDLYNKKVYGGKDGTKKIGKVRNFVFHPSEKRLVGFMVKRPDAALMFHRKDLFVRLGCLVPREDDTYAVAQEAGATDAAACKYLKVNWDSCILWWGLPVLCEDGTYLGTVGHIAYAEDTGKVLAFQVDTHSTEETLLGTRDIPAHLIRGFKRGMGSPLAQQKDRANVQETEDLGAMLVADEAKDMKLEGGLAEAAGFAAAKTAATARVVVKRVKPKVTKAATEAKDAVAPKVGAAATRVKEAVAPKLESLTGGERITKENAARLTGEVAGRGMSAAGRQLGRAAGMFSAFKAEYDKAAHGEDE